MTEMLDRVRAVIKSKVKTTSWVEIDEAAKAVLLEIRTPTQRMIDAGQNEVVETGYAQEIWRQMCIAAVRDR